MVRLCSSGAHGALHVHRAAFVRRLPCVEACIKCREIRCINNIKRLNLLIIDVMLQAAEASTVGQHRAGRHSVIHGAKHSSSVKAYAGDKWDPGGPGLKQ